MKFRILPLLAFNIVFSTSVVWAQADELDAFGDLDDDEVAEAQAAAEQTETPTVAPSSELPGVTAPIGGSGDAAAQQLFGGAVTGLGSALPVAGPSRGPKWGDLNQIQNQNQGRIEDTYEMQMREELAKPLPKRSPFGDRMGDMKSRLTPKVDPSANPFE